MKGVAKEALVLVKKALTFSCQDRYIPLNDCPDDRIIDRWILMGEQVAEVYDPSTVTDLGENSLSVVAQGDQRLAYYRELPFH